MAIAFDRVVIVMLENALRSNVLKNPYMNALRSKGVFLSNSYGVTHSSQPNYIASVAGDTLTLWNDDAGYARWVYEPVSIYAECIVDLLEARGLSWKSYAEDMPANYNEQNAACWEDNRCKRPSQWKFPLDKEVTGGLFTRKHVPFLSFPRIIADPAYASEHIVPATQLEVDLDAGELPNYSFYTPNMVNDGHDKSEEPGERSPFDRTQNVENIANFLQGLLGDDPIAKFPPETLIVVTFDEAYPYGKRNEIYTLLIGDMLTAGTTRTEPYNHYSLLRSVEENFGLGTLGRNDSAARPFWFLR